jgi:hypothetical protein
MEISVLFSKSTPGCPLKQEAILQGLGKTTGNFGRKKKGTGRVIFILFYSLH